MSVYIVMLLLLSGLALIEGLYYDKSNISLIIYYVIFGFLTMMLGFRYNQGTDYPAYQTVYYSIPPIQNITITELMKLGINGDTGWTLINSCFRGLNFKFYQFVFVLAISEMLMLNRYIRLHCGRHRFLAMLMSYHTLYLSYMFSSLREALVLCIFLAFLLDMYLQKKYIVFCVVVCMCATVHLAAITYMIPIIIKYFNNKPGVKIQRELGCFCMWIIGGILYLRPVHDLLYAILPWRITFYMDYEKPSVLAISLQIVTFITIVYMFQVAKRKMCIGTQKWLEYDDMYSLYLFGNGIYGIFLQVPFIAAKSSMLLTIVQIGLICVLLSLHCYDSRRIFIYILIVFCMLMTMKNIQSYVDQGKYATNIFTYPYISIFNAKEVY